MNSVELILTSWTAPVIRGLRGVSANLHSRLLMLELNFHSFPLVTCLFVPPPPQMNHSIDKEHDSVYVS